MVPQVSFQHSSTRPWAAIELPASLRSPLLQYTEKMHKKKQVKLYRIRWNLHKEKVIIYLSNGVIFSSYVKQTLVFYLIY